MTTRYVGKECEYLCPGIDENGNGQSCMGNGKCVTNESNTAAICECTNEYFMGPRCTPKCPGTRIEKEQFIQCENHGICGSNGECTCDFGYYGKDCKSSCPGLVIIDGLLKECSGNGKCNKNTLKCECDGNDFDQETCGGKCESVETCNRRGLCNS